MDSLWQDLRHATRTLLRRPAFTIMAVLTIALGIGANTAIFSVVDALVLHPLPFSNMDRLVAVWERIPSQGVDRNEVAPANFLDWRAQNRSFQHFGAYAAWDANLSSVVPPERVMGYRISPDLLEALGERAALGRTFTAEEEQQGKDHVLLLSYGYWRERFGSDPAIVGKTLVVNGIERTVVGVMPARFSFPSDARVWAPLSFSPQAASNRRAHFLLTVGLLKPGVSRQQALSEMNSIAARLESAFPVSNTGRQVRIDSLSGDVSRFFRPALFLLLGAVSFVLLIACANVANLLLARAAGRQKEIAIRAALGAGRFRLARQPLTESVLLSLLGGGAGILLASWGLALLIAAIPGEFFQFIAGSAQIAINQQVLLYTVAISCATGIIFGLAPALQASKTDLVETLKETGRGSGTSAGQHRLRSALVVTEVALSTILLIGSGLMLKSFVHLQAMNPGFNQENLVSLSIALPGAKYSTPQQILNFYDQLLERVQAVPGVRAATAVNLLPLGGANQTLLFLGRDLPEPPHGQEPEASYRVIVPNYFRTMEIPLIRGREFTAQDSSHSAPVVIVNQELARRYWPHDDPVGKQIRTPGPSEEHPWQTIVGVVADVTEDLTERRAATEVYFAQAQDPSSSMTLVLRTPFDPAGVVPAVREQVQALDPGQPIFDVRTMKQVRSVQEFGPRFSGTLMSVFAVLALVLAAIGMYAVIAYMVTQRTHEIGVRIALGAQTRDVLRLVTGHGLRLTLVGIAIGLPLAFGISFALTAILFGVKPGDPLTFAGIPLLLLGVALLASYVPARRATRVDPIVALRYE